MHLQLAHDRSMPQGGSRLTVTGTLFLPPLLVLVGGESCLLDPATITPTRLECLLPAGRGSGQSVMVSSKGQVRLRRFRCVPRA